MSWHGNRDRTVLLALAGGVLLLIGLTAFLAPVTRDDDPTPSTYNSGSRGTKAAFLLLGDLGYSVDRTGESATALDRADAPHTTYVLTGPNMPAAESSAREYAAVERFLSRGGRVVATGFAGAYFFPEGRAAAEGSQLVNGLCTTTAEGRGALAQTAPLSLYGSPAWAGTHPAYRVDQRCGPDPVMVHRPYPHGGMAVWMSSAEPLSNRGIGQDNGLRLLLAAVGPSTGPFARRVVFDEFYHGVESSPTDYLRGLPLRSLVIQAALVAGLLLFSYSRRRGPIREPVRVPRSSPLEFAESMGVLYSRAGATQPATEAARRRFLRFAVEGCGIPRSVADGPAADLATLLETRFGMDAAQLRQDLERITEARYEKLRPREAHALVRAMDAHLAALRARVQPAPTPVILETT